MQLHMALQKYWDQFSDLIEQQIQPWSVLLFF